jgi:hypothetical protein
MVPRPTNGATVIIVTNSPTTIDFAKLAELFRQGADDHQRSASRERQMAKFPDAQARSAHFAALARRSWEIRRARAAQGSLHNA